MSGPTVQEQAAFNAAVNERRRRRAEAVAEKMRERFPEASPLTSPLTRLEALAHGQAPAADAPCCPFHASGGHPDDRHGFDPAGVVYQPRGHDHLRFDADAEIGRINEMVALRNAQEPRS